MRTSVCTRADYKRSFESQYGDDDGLLHVHMVEFEDGTKGEYCSKSEHQDKFVVGEEATFTAEEMPPKGKRKAFIKVKPANPDGFGGGSGGGSSKGGGKRGDRRDDPVTRASIHRQGAWKDAITLLTFDKIPEGDSLNKTMDNVKIVVEYIFKDLQRIAEEAENLG